MSELVDRASPPPVERRGPQRSCPFARSAALAALLLSLPACTLVGYPSGRVSDSGVPARGPRAVPASTTVPDDEPSPRVADRPVEAPREIDADDVVDADVRPLRNAPADRSDAGREYEVFGVRYRVMNSPVGYDVEGHASWYGEQFNGRPTASGEIFDMHGYSAAHRTLPLHTWVEVTNLENGRRVVVKVNDRGPFVDTDERLIDLSMGAARRLDMIGAGVAQVRIRAVEPPEGG